jgi:hypothetical protein
MKLNSSKVSKKSKTLRFFSGLKWKKVCRIRSHGSEWYYEDIDEKLMFSNHRSWVYVILVNGCIYKVGETGNPLGIYPERSSDPIMWECQPKSSSTNRFGRYRKGDCSDERIRKELLIETCNSDSNVEFWAYKCEELIETLTVNGYEIKIKAQIHKSLEKELLTLYQNVTGCLPPGNTGLY